MNRIHVLDSSSSPSLFDSDLDTIALDSVIFQEIADSEEVNDSEEVDDSEVPEADTTSNYDIKKMNKNSKDSIEQWEFTGKSLKRQLVIINELKELIEVKKKYIESIANFDSQIEKLIEEKIKFIQGKKTEEDNLKTFMSNISGMQSKLSLEVVDVKSKPFQEVYGKLYNCSICLQTKQCPEMVWFDCRHYTCHICRKNIIKTSVFVKKGI